MEDKENFLQGRARRDWSTKGQDNSLIDTEIQPATKKITSASYVSGR